MTTLLELVLKIKNRDVQVLHLEKLEVLRIGCIA